MATGVVVAGTTQIRNDGGSIFTSPGTTFGTTRFDEFTEGVGYGPQVNTLPKSGLATIDQINAAATDYCQPGHIIAKVTTDIAGVANTVIQKMDRGVVLQTPKRDDASGINTATAIRNNQWSTISGVFTTAPASQNSAWGTDFSSVPTGGITSTTTGRMRFMAGAKTPSGVALPGKTCW